MLSLNRPYTLAETQRHGQIPASKVPGGEPTGLMNICRGNPVTPHRVAVAKRYKEALAAHHPTRANLPGRPRKRTAPAPDRLI